MHSLGEPPIFPTLNNSFWKLEEHFSGSGQPKTLCWQRSCKQLVNFVTSFPLQSPGMPILPMLSLLIKILLIYVCSHTYSSLISWLSTQSCGTFNMLNSPRHAESQALLFLFHCFPWIPNVFSTHCFVSYPTMSLPNISASELFFFSLM